MWRLPPAEDGRVAINATRRRFAAVRLRLTAGRRAGQQLRRKTPAACSAMRNSRHSDSVAALAATRLSRCGGGPHERLKRRRRL